MHGLIMMKLLIRTFMEHCITGMLLAPANYVLLVGMYLQMENGPLWKTILLKMVIIMMVLPSEIKYQRHWEQQHGITHLTPGQLAIQTTLIKEMQVALQPFRVVSVTRRVLSPPMDTTVPGGVQPSI